MAAPLLETKLYVPRSPRGLVPRARLRERLDQGSTSRLLLVSAPAGFGKTTLLTEWLAEWLAAAPAASTGERSAAWLSLDQGDNRPGTFWTYVVAALRTVEPAVGANALALLEASPPAPIEAVLTELLNDVSALASDLVLVLDDYHVIDARDVHEGMAFLLDHLPPRLHLVIASRADPALPLARLRARGELVETRALDLRFTPDEAAAYLNEVMGLDLTAQDLAALEGRTEGWIAALQLAALSMQGRDDVAGFIAGFAGEDRYIVDYLVEEVVQRQSERVQDFLLQTSVLARLSGPLCDAVTGQGGGKAMLEALDRGNLFLVPLDDRRHWYRYHHLFADVLQARLLDERPDLVPELHRRASVWLEDNGERDAAVGHALAADDFERAADLLEHAWPVMQSSRQEAALHAWLQALPEHVLQRRPVLCVAYAGVLLLIGRFDGVEALLVTAERLMASPTDPSAPMVVADQDLFRRLPAQMALYRAALALARGDLAAVSSDASRALELAAEDDYLEKGSAAGVMGLALWTSGDLEAGHQMYSACTANLVRAGWIADTYGCALALADIRITQGRLRDAMRTYEQALIVASPGDGTVLRGAADMYVGMADIHRERDDLEAAQQNLLTSRDLGEHKGLRQNPYRWRVAMARIREAEGDLDGALRQLDEAQRLYTGDMFPDVRPVPAMRARLLVRRGDLAEAVGWADERGLSFDDELPYLREFEHVTLARLLLARYESERGQAHLDQAAALLERLLQVAEQGGRTGTVIEILLLQALASQLRGDVPAALEPLERALALAEPEGYVRVFLDEGAPMSALLAAAAERGIAPSSVRRLRGAAVGATQSAPVAQRLVEPLSERELAVLRLLRTELAGPEIAGQLVVSLHTVRSHTKSIYAKLGVNNRRAAVRRAEELDLFG